MISMHAINNWKYGIESIHIRTYSNEFLIDASIDYDRDSRVQSFNVGFSRHSI